MKGGRRAAGQQLDAVQRGDHHLLEPHVRLRRALDVLHRVPRLCRAVKVEKVPAEVPITELELQYVDLEPV